MIIDRTTLADLEVFVSQDGKAGVFDLIARTSTNIGRAALRRRLETPFTDVDSIRRTQRVVAFLRDHPNTVRIDDSLVTRVARYLRSNIDIGRESSLREHLIHAWMRLRYRDLLLEIGDGVDAVSNLLDSIRRVARALTEADPPRGLLEVLNPLMESSELILGRLSREKTILGVDRACRTVLKRDIEHCLRLLAELDALNAMALTTAAYGWALPELVESQTFVLEGEGIGHPFVPDAVTNPVRLSGGEPLVFLTGPNMAGKTTYLRSIALVVLLAQIGMGVPARSVRLSPVEALFTSLNPSDNLRAGVSYFMAEVLRVKAAATILAEGKRALVIFDEVFKGTNVSDALDASAEVILGFARARRSGFVFSSHLIELVEVLKSNASIRFSCFDGEVIGGRVHYSYQIRDGISDKRFGMLLLREAHIQDLIAKIA